MRHDHAPAHGKSVRGGSLMRDPQLAEAASDPSTTTPQTHQTLLVGSWQSVRRAWDACPAATTVTAWSVTLGHSVIIAQRCGRWGCRHCGERKIVHFAKRVEAAQPNRLVTLTVNPARHADPRAAYDATRRTLPAYITKLRRRHGPIEFFRVLEATKKGWPHYHLVTRSGYLPQAELSRLWDEMTGAPIVDVRQIKRRDKVYFYVVKYLAKQTHVPWTNRRVSWTRSFFAASQLKPGPRLELQDNQWSAYSPSSYLVDNCPKAHLVRYSRDCWVFMSPDEKPTWEPVRFDEAEDESF